MQEKQIITIEVTAIEGGKNIKVNTAGLHYWEIIGALEYAKETVRESKDKVLKDDDENDV